MTALIAIAIATGVPQTLAQKGGAGVPLPADFQVRFEFRAGSVPPPYYYQYTITIDARGSGEMVIQPDYDFNKPQTWRVPFSVSAEALTSMYRLLRDRNVFGVNWPAGTRPTVGGEIITAAITADGRTARVTADVHPERKILADFVFATITSIVPGEAWKELSKRRTDYEASYSKRPPG